jgi:hypothetical protein
LWRKQTVGTGSNEVEKLDEFIESEFAIVECFPEILFGCIGANGRLLGEAG